MGAAADLLPTVHATSGRHAEIGEGPRWEIVVSPGVLRVRTRDHAKAERTYERQQRRRRIDADMAVAWLREGQDVPELLTTRGAITAWSPRSRTRMIARLSDLDYTRLYGRYRTYTRVRARLRPGRRPLPDVQVPRLDHDGSHRAAPGHAHLDLPRRLAHRRPHRRSRDRALRGAVQALRPRLGRGVDRTVEETVPAPRRPAPAHLHHPPMGFTTITDPATGARREADFKTWLSITWAG